MLDWFSYGVGSILRSDILFFTFSKRAWLKCDSIYLNSNWPCWKDTGPKVGYHHSQHSFFKPRFEGLKIQKVVSMTSIKNLFGRKVRFSVENFTSLWAIAYFFKEKLSLISEIRYKNPTCFALEMRQKWTRKVEFFIRFQKRTKNII